MALLGVFGRRTVRGPLSVRAISTRVPNGPYDVLFCGTDGFASTILERLAAHKELYNTIQVLTPPDAQHSWGGKRMRVSPVKQFAQAYKFPIEHVPASGMDQYALPEALRSSSAPLLLTVSFGHMIPQSILREFPSASQTLNVHPSLLPQLRGAAPIQWAIARQLDMTGVSVQQLAPEHFDTGRILGQVPMPIVEGSTYKSLASELASLGSELLVDVIAHLRERDQEAWSQDAAKATRAPKLKKSVGEVKWTEWDADKVDARMRAFGDYVPLMTTLVPAKASFPPVAVSIREGASLRRTAQGSLAELDAQAHAALSDRPPGSATYSSVLNAMVVRCASSNDNAFLATKLQTQGKPVRNAGDWWLGFHDRSDDDGCIRFAHS